MILANRVFMGEKTEIKKKKRVVDYERLIRADRQRAPSVRNAPFYDLGGRKGRDGDLEIDYT